MQEKFLIRPHHMLCLQFFEGKGYSDDFVRNMTNIKSKLDRENPILNIVHCTDDICADCPKKINKKCINEESVQGHDDRVYKKIAEDVGDCARWEDIKQAVYKNIIDAGNMKEICQDCSWSYICFNKY